MLLVYTYIYIYIYIYIYLHVGVCMCSVYTNMQIYHDKYVCPLLTHIYAYITGILYMYNMHAHIRIYIYIYIYIHPFAQLYRHMNTQNITCF